MSEAWVLGLLSDVRDAARAGGLFRLAEHIDDALLVAASEFHEAGAWAVEERRGGCENGDAVRGAGGHRLH